ncbi:hypothetical protein RQP46_007986 [Phenoliferia psychrophenolica]
MSTLQDAPKLEEKSSFEHAENVLVERPIRTVEEEAALRKSLLWKLDSRILPVLAFLFLFSFLDRTNIGNARILGLQKDLDLDSAKYENCLAIYYVFYLAVEIPATLVMKWISPKIWLPLLTALWGLTAAMMGVAKNYHEFLAVRAFLGLLEGGLLPGMILYLSMLYKRDEMALRMGLVYSSASLSGAFGGLLATGLNRMAGVGGRAGWQWIFIMEGLMTIVVGSLAYFVLIKDVDTAWFLTPEERIYARERLRDDGPQDLDDKASFDRDRFSWYQFRQGAFNVQTWLLGCAFFCIVSAVYSFGLFVPTIIRDLGHSAISAQLYSVPPYAACLTVGVALLSDRLKVRGPIMLCCLPIAIAGYALIRTSRDNNVRYGALFMMCSGFFTSVPCVMVWLSNNIAGHYKRATATSLQLTIANFAGFVATFIYPSREGPNYVRGHTIVLSLLCTAWVLTATNVAYCAYQNKRKAEGKCEEFRGDGSDRDPAFKYIL